MDNKKMPKGTYDLPTKEGILTIVAVLITATLIEMDSSLILIIISGAISISMFIMDMLYCYSKQVKHIRKKLKLFKKEKTLD